MKRKGLLILSSLLICMATLCVGIYALVPLSVTITGTLTIIPSTVSNISINLAMIATGQSGDDIVLSEKTVNGARRFSVADLLFNDISTIEKGVGDEVIITFTITNNATATTNQEKSDNAIGIFFSENASVGNRTALASDVLVSYSDSTTTASLSSYTAILPQETIKMEITLNLDNTNSITETDVPYYLYVEEYVCEATTDGLVKLPIINSDSTLFTKLSRTTLSSMGIEITEIQYVAIPSTITKIGADTFSDCTSLTKIIIPPSITIIDACVFLGCSSLKEVTIPPSVTIIDAYVFCGCSSLKEVTIPPSVTSIGFQAFYGCSSLKEITIPPSVTSIAEAAFEDSGLTKIIIPSSVTFIDVNTFLGCSDLKEITIPSSVTSIGNSAFLACTSLKEITIPYSVSTIGMNAFYGCTSLTKIIVKAHNTSGNFSATLPAITGSAWYIAGGTKQQTKLAYSTTTITYIRKSV